MHREERLPYSLGALLYTPATHTTAAEHLLNRDRPSLTSIAFCLEDSIRESGLPEAEKQLTKTLRQLHAANADDLPLVFVRVKNPGHLLHIYAQIYEYTDILTGFIFPKFDLSNAEDYMSALRQINKQSPKQLYGMPILESPPIASILTRKECLQKIRTILDRDADLILNVRVGGNDFCNLYGLRRKVDQSIYDLGLVRDILIDILNVFADAYVVSGPVWEYYGNDERAPWAVGLRRELELDRANGFIGKTCIHPSQIPLINRSMMVSREDYLDARQIIGWQDSTLGVAGSCAGNRMNEVRCHSRWAKMILCRAEVFGIDETQ